MFQTDFIKYLQSFETPWLTDAMTYITSLGYAPFFFGAFLVIIFGVDFKKGFILLQVLMLTAALTEFLKNTFALPRPFHVDSNVLKPDEGMANNAPFKNRGAGSFMELLPQEVVEYYRGLPEKISYGLPSGHTSSAVTFWGSLMLLFRNNFVRFLSILMIILVPFSRLYLGRHFPADVLAGYTLGALILVLFYSVFFGPARLDRFLASKSMGGRVDLTGNLFKMYLVAIPIPFFILLPDYFSKFTGYWFGINIIFVMMSGSRSPEFSTFWSRIISLLIAVASFLLIEWGGREAVNLLGMEETSYTLFVSGTIVAFFGVLLTLNINRKLNLYK